MKTLVEVEARVRAHPWSSVALAVAFGAWLAFEPALRSLTFRIARDLAFREITGRLVA